MNLIFLNSIAIPGFAIGVSALKVEPSSNPGLVYCDHLSTNTPVKMN